MTIIFPLMNVHCLLQEGQQIQNWWKKQKTKIDFVRIIWKKQTNRKVIMKIGRENDITYMESLWESSTKQPFKPYGKCPTFVKH